MKYLLALLIILAVGIAGAAPDPNLLAGNWTGSITKNLKDEKGGGSPTQGTTGTPVTIHFSKAGTELVGTSTVGSDKENWKIHGDQYTWDDGKITVTAKLVSFNDIPEWVRKQANLTTTDNIFAYKFSSCTVNATKKPCEIKKDLPDGIDKSGLWLFKVQGEKMDSSVYYTYSSGGQRILEQSLKLSKK